MAPLIAKRTAGVCFFSRHRHPALARRDGVGGLGWVKVKMLPFDNKSEFQIILNMPEGSSLEAHRAVSRARSRPLFASNRKSSNYQIYAGVAVAVQLQRPRATLLHARGANVADIQINLVPKGDRKAQSHDIAKRIRPRVTAIAARYGARVAVAEVPPGPPVLQTLVAEIYGPSEESRLALATNVIAIFENTPGVVDVDWYIEADQPKARFVIDKEKAALTASARETISRKHCKSP